MIKYYLLIATGLILFSCATIPDSSLLQNKTVIASSPGINWGYPKKERLNQDLFIESGLKVLRIDFFWSRLEKIQGEWDFRELDYFCNYAKQNNFKIVGVLAYDTPWIHGDTKGLREISSENLKHYLNYVEVVVDRYKDFVMEWEVWNEPNTWGKRFWTGTDKEFFDMTKATVDVIHNIDNDAFVLAGSFWRYDTSFIKNMFKSGALDNADAVSFHPYEITPKGTYNTSYKIMELCRNLGFKGEFRITEVGFPTGGYYPTKSSEEGQGRYYLETVNYLNYLNLPYTIWYTLGNSADFNPKDSEEQFGLFLVGEFNQYEYKTGGWAFRRYSELISGKILVANSTQVDKKLTNKIIISTYITTLDSKDVTLLLIGNTKEKDLVLEGFESGTIYNCSTGEIKKYNPGDRLILLKDEPLIVVSNSINSTGIIISPFI